MKITLEAARVNKGFTQKEAASKLGISEKTLRDYEKGKAYPNIPMLVKIEKLYDTSYNNLIFLIN